MRAAQQTMAWMCFLILLRIPIFAQSGWTWIIMDANVPADNPGYVDITLGIEAASESQSGRLGNFNIRGTNSAALFGIGDTASPDIVSIYPDSFDITLTPCPLQSTWQINAVYEGESVYGPSVDPNGIPVLTLRFFIRDTSGTSDIRYVSMAQTFTDNNMQSMPVQFNDSGGDVNLWHIVNGVEVRQSHAGDIVLIWPDQPENRLGFHVWRAFRKAGSYTKRTLQLIIPAKDYGEYIDSEVQSNTVYWYKIEAVLPDGTSSFLGPVASSVRQSIPDHFDLSLNFPNPFNASTQFTYQLPEACEVSAIVYNLLGQKIRTLILEKQDAGTYNLVWDGTDIAGTVLPSGIYMLRFRAGSFSRIQKMMVIK